MKLALSILLLGLSAGAAMAQSQPRDDHARVPAPVVASPFQALGNIIRNPDADRPRSNRRTAPAVTPAAIPPGAIANPQGTDSPSP